MTYEMSLVRKDRCYTILFIEANITTFVNKFLLSQNMPREKLSFNQTEYYKEREAKTLITGNGPVPL